MKFRPNKHYTTIAIYAFLVLAAIIIFFQAITNLPVLMSAGKALLQFIQPVTYGFIFAFLLNPLLRLYDDRFLVFVSRGKMRPKTRRTIALLLTYPTILLILTIFFSIVIPQLITSIESLFDYKYVGIFNEWYSNIMKALEDLSFLENDNQNQIESLLQDLSTRLSQSIESLLGNLYEYITSLLPQIFSAGARFTTGLLNFLLGIIISIYFLFDREKLFAQLKKVTHALCNDRTYGLLYDIALDANRVFSGFITGKIIDSLIIGVICFTVMSILKLDYTVLISVIVGVTNIIPYFGPFIGAVPCVLILLISSPVQALIFAIFILVLQQFDGNILGPKILGDTTGLSALWVIFAIMLFSGLFGVLGMFIGVPLFAMIYNIVRRTVNHLLRKKGLSENTRDYDSDKNSLLR